MGLETAIDARLPSALETPARARQRLSEVDGVLAPARASEAQLLVSELVTNALMHAPRGGGIRLRIALGGDRMRVEVYDPGQGFEPVRPPPAPAAAAPRGRGLFLLDQLADRWGNARTREGHCVWFELDRGERRGP